MKIKAILTCAGILSSILLGSSAYAAGEKSVTIVGDTESPTVLYLVPWKTTPSSLGNTDFEMEIDFEFEPLSRSEVIREVRYFKEIGYDKNIKATVTKDLKVIRK